VDKFEEKRLHGKRRCRWKHILRMYLKGTGMENANWIQYFQSDKQWSALVNAVVKT
jgi:hypothetical protein